MVVRDLPRWVGLALASASLCLLAACQRQQPARFVTTVPWAPTGQWVVVDLHSHTKFTDGSLTVSELVKLAEESGCQGLAITDHSDRKLGAATDEYFTSITMARDLHPDMMILAGMEWNIPPYGEREHAGLLLDRKLERKVLPEFKSRFDGGKEDVKPALEWLARATEGGTAVLIYNHPNRKGGNPEEKLKDMQAWRKVNSLFVGFEGGPGHQRGAAPGAYIPAQGGLQSRWDSAVARVGGSWDTLLASGQDVWGAVADSDFHNMEGDFPPCGFARTHVLVAKRDADALVRALKAGAFWADHGQILKELQFQLMSAGLPEPAMPGEAIEVGGHASVDIGLALQRGRGAEGAPLTVEIIGNGRDGQVAVLAAAKLPPSESKLALTLNQVHPGSDGKSAFFRARVRRASDDGSGDLQAYTNPIRVQVN